MATRKRQTRRASVSDAPGAAQPDARHRRWSGPGRALLSAGVNAALAVGLLHGVFLAQDPPPGPSPVAWSSESTAGRAPQPIASQPIGPPPAAPSTDAATAVVADTPPGTPFTPSPHPRRAGDPEPPRLLPPPIAREDALFRAAASPTTNGRWSLATLVAAEPDPVYADLALWRRLRDGDGDWATLSDFLARRGHWPAAERIRRAAERAMPDTLPAGEAVRFFAEAEPETAHGARRYGEALIALGEKARGEAWVTRGWRERRADAAEEDAYLAAHPGLLSGALEDRIALHLAAERATAASRLARKADSDWQALTKAAAALLRRGRGVDSLIAQVPEALRDHPSLTAARVTWRIKKGRHADAETLLREATEAGVAGRPEAWADARKRYARDAFEDDRPGDAYALAAPHGLTGGVDFADLEWFAGWVALQRLDDAAGARAHFERMWEGVGAPISRGRAAYWAGRAAAADGDSAGARDWYGRAARHPQTFYGQLALTALNAPLEFPTEPVQAAKSGPASRTAAELIAISERLYRADRRGVAGAFLSAAAGAAAQRNDMAGLESALTLAERMDDAGAAVAAGTAALEAGEARWPALYPTPRTPHFLGAQHTEPALLLAVARQESRFRSDAASGAGALGVMQMTPGTARATARQAGMPFDQERLTGDPEYNLRLADVHMADLLDRYGGSTPLAAAAYNAGPGAVSDWLTRFGDPRDPDVDWIDWIESIPYGETRNYVQRVMEATAVYRALLNGGTSATAAARPALLSPPPQAPLIKASSGAGADTLAHLRRAPAAELPR